MVTNAWIEKEEKETQMKLEWLNTNGYDEVYKLSRINIKLYQNSRMTRLTACLCLSIMILRITCSATITIT